MLAFLPGLGALGYVADAVAGCGSWAEAYLLDLPGFGHPPPCAPEVPALAATVATWLGAVAPGRDVVLAGHSTGAQVALRAAAACPVRSLVLLGPTFPPSQRTIRGLVGPVLRTVPRERPGLVGATVPYYARGPRALVRFLRSALRDAPEQVIPDVDAPVLLARGEHDGFATPEWLDHLADRARHARVVTTPGAHAFPYGRGGYTAALLSNVHKGRVL